MVWRGVLIEESLGDISILDKVTQVGYAESFLEEEEDKGIMHFHQFEIADEKKNWFIEESKKLLKDGWYTHIGDGKTLIIIFRHKVFEFSLDDRHVMEEARSYGRSIGIIDDQMSFEHLVKDPFY
ncbi:MAG: hypothetical protein HY517_01320 [Candidatus Aenigmarchaeota archaeon]|nr:hypothetical protein [Candidatus Aenigmarchaeota archaeon]